MSKKVCISAAALLAAASGYGVYQVLRRKATSQVSPVTARLNSLDITRLEKALNTIDYQLARFNLAHSWYTGPEPAALVARLQKFGFKILLSDADKRALQSYSRSFCRDLFNKFDRASLYANNGSEIRFKAVALIERYVEEGILPDNLAFRATLLKAVLPPMVDADVFIATYIAVGSEHMLEQRGWHLIANCYLTELREDCHSTVREFAGLILDAQRGIEYTDWLLDSTVVPRSFLRTELSDTEFWCENCSGRCMCDLDDAEDDDIEDIDDSEGQSEFEHLNHMFTMQDEEYPEPPEGTDFEADSLDIDVLEDTDNEYPEPPEGEDFESSILGIENFGELDSDDEHPEPPAEAEFEPSGTDEPFGIDDVDECPEDISIDDEPDEFTSDVSEVWNGLTHEKWTDIAPELGSFDDKQGDFSFSDVEVAEPEFDA